MNPVRIHEGRGFFSVTGTTFFFVKCKQTIECSCKDAVDKKIYNERINITFITVIFLPHFKNTLVGTQDQQWPTSTSCCRQSSRIFSCSGICLEILIYTCRIQKRLQKTQNRLLALPSTETISAASPPPSRVQTGLS